MVSAHQPLISRSCKRRMVMKTIKTKIGRNKMANNGKMTVRIKITIEAKNIATWSHQNSAREIRHLVSKARAGISFMALTKEII